MSSHGKKSNKTESNKSFSKTNLNRKSSKSSPVKSHNSKSGKSFSATCDAISFKPNLEPAEHSSYPSSSRNTKPERVSSPASNNATLTKSSGNSLTTPYDAEHSESSSQYYTNVNTNKHDFMLNYNLEARKSSSPTCKSEKDKHPNTTLRSSKDSSPNSKSAKSSPTQYNKYRDSYRREKPHTSPPMEWSNKKYRETPTKSSNTKSDESISKTKFDKMSYSRNSNDIKFGESPSSSTMHGYRKSSNYNCWGKSSDKEYRQSNPFSRIQSAVTPTGPFTSKYHARDVNRSFPTARGRRKSRIYPSSFKPSHTRMRRSHSFSRTHSHSASSKSFSSAYDDRNVNKYSPRGHNDSRSRKYSSWAKASNMKQEQNDSFSRTHRAMTPRKSYSSRHDDRNVSRYSPRTHDKLKSRKYSPWAKNSDMEMERNDSFSRRRSALTPSKSYSSMHDDRNFGKYSPRGRNDSKSRKYPAWVKASDMEVERSNSFSRTHSALSPRKSHSPIYDDGNVGQHSPERRDPDSKSGESSWVSASDTELEKNDSFSRTNNDLTPSKCNSNRIYTPLRRTKNFPRTRDDFQFRKYSNTKLKRRDSFSKKQEDKSFPAAANNWNPFKAQSGKYSSTTCLSEKSRKSPTIDQNAECSKSSPTLNCTSPTKFFSPMSPLEKNSNSPSTSLKTKFSKSCVTTHDDSNVMRTPSKPCNNMKTNENISPTKSHAQSSTRASKETSSKIFNDTKLNTHSSMVCSDQRNPLKCDDAEFKKCYPATNNDAEFRKSPPSEFRKSFTAVTNASVNDTEASKSSLTIENDVRFRNTPKKGDVTKLSKKAVSKDNINALKSSPLALGKYSKKSDPKISKSSSENDLKARNTPTKKSDVIKFRKKIESNSDSNVQKSSREYSESLAAANETEASKSCAENDLKPRYTPTKKGDVIKFRKKIESNSDSKAQKTSREYSESLAAANEKDASKSVENDLKPRNTPTKKSDVIKFRKKIESNSDSKAQKTSREYSESLAAANNTEASKSCAENDLKPRYTPTKKGDVIKFRKKIESNSDSKSQKTSREYSESFAPANNTEASKSCAENDLKPRYTPTKKGDVIKFRKKIESNSDSKSQKTSREYSESLAAANSTEALKSSLSKGDVAKFSKKPFSKSDTNVSRSHLLEPIQPSLAVENDAKSQKMFPKKDEVIKFKKKTSSKSDKKTSKSTQAEFSKSSLASESGGKARKTSPKKEDDTKRSKKIASKGETNGPKTPPEYSEVLSAAVLSAVNDTELSKSSLPRSTDLKFRKKGANNSDTEAQKSSQPELSKSTLILENNVKSLGTPSKKNDMKFCKTPSSKSDTKGSKSSLPELTKSPLAPENGVKPRKQLSKKGDVLKFSKEIVSKSDTKGPKSPEYSESPSKFSKPSLPKGDVMKLSKKAAKNRDIEALKLCPPELSIPCLTPENDVKRPKSPPKEDDVLKFRKKTLSKGVSKGPKSPPQYSESNDNDIKALKSSLPKGDIKKVSKKVERNSDIEAVKSSQSEVSGKCILPPENGVKPQETPSKKDGLKFRKKTSSKDDIKGPKSSSECSESPSTAVASAVNDTGVPKFPPNSNVLKFRKKATSNSDTEVLKSSQPEISKSSLVAENNVKSREIPSKKGELKFRKKIVSKGDTKAAISSPECSQSLSEAVLPAVNNTDATKSSLPKGDVSKKVSVKSDAGGAKSSLSKFSQSTLAPENAPNSDTNFRKSSAKHSKSRCGESSSTKQEITKSMDMAPMICDEARLQKPGTTISQGAPTQKIALPACDDSKCSGVSSTKPCKLALNKVSKSPPPTAGKGTTSGNSLQISATTSNTTAPSRAFITSKDNAKPVPPTLTASSERHPNAMIVPTTSSKYLAATCLNTNSTHTTSPTIRSFDCQRKRHSSSPYPAHLSKTPKVCSEQQIPLIPSSDEKKSDNRKEPLVNKKDIFDVNAPFDDFKTLWENFELCVTVCRNHWQRILDDMKKRRIERKIRLIQGGESIDSFMRRFPID